MYRRSDAPADALDDGLDIELRRLRVDLLTVHPDREHAAGSGLELDAVDLLPEAFQDGLLSVDGAGQVVARDAVLDLNGWSSHCLPFEVECPCGASRAEACATLTATD